MPLSASTLLQPVLDTALDAVVVMDQAGLIADWNRVAEQTFGWSRQEAVGRNLAELIVPPRFQDAHARGLEHYLKTGEGPVLRRRIEVSALARDGREFPVELSVTPTGESENLVFLGFLRDITDRRRADRLLERRAIDAELLHRVTVLAAETASFDGALRACLGAICEVTGWTLGHAFLVAEGQPRSLAPSMIWHPQDGGFESLRTASNELRFVDGVGMPGRILAGGEPEWVNRADVDPGFLRAEALRRSGLKAAFGFPIKFNGEVVAVLEFFSEREASPDADLLLTVRTIGEQLGRVFERRRAADRQREEKLALEREVAERRRVEQHQLLLLSELDHRVKNTLTVVMGIAAQTARASRSLEEFQASFSERLAALSRAHGLLTAQHWEGTPLRLLLEDVLSPHLRGRDARVALSGPDFVLTPKATLAMSLILHELITNAVKHGALSAANGDIAVAWTLDKAGEEERATVTWRETGVPGTAPPQRRGFGSKLIEASVRMELGGSSSAIWHNDGLEQIIAFPISGQEAPA